MFGNFLRQRSIFANFYLPLEQKNKIDQLVLKPVSLQTGGLNQYFVWIHYPFLSKRQENVF